MGVTGLWRLIEPAGKPVPVETLENKVLAVDISIWLHQMVKGYQDAKGAPLPNAHLMGLFQRLCKLLYFRIKPVFVFDGAFPDLKKETIAKRQDNKTKYNSQSEKLKREIALLLGKKTAISALLGKQISPKKNKQVEDKDDLFKLPALPDKESETESESDDEHDTKRCIVDLHSVDLESEKFKNLPLKEKYDLLVELKETRKMNSWGKIHTLPKKSDNFSDFQMQRLLKRRKLQECLEETEKEIGDGGMSLAELESLLNEEGIDTKIDSLPSRRIASNNTTRYLLISSVKQALEAAKKKETDVAKLNDSPGTSTEEVQKSSHQEEEDDLQKAIKMSLECVDEADTSVCASKTDDSWTSVLTDSDYSDDEDDDGFQQPDNMSSAKAYIMQYSDFTHQAIDDIVISKQKVKNKSKQYKIDDIIDELNEEKIIVEDKIELTSSDDEAISKSVNQVFTITNNQQSIIDTKQIEDKNGSEESIIMNELKTIVEDNIEQTSSDKETIAKNVNEVATITTNDVPSLIDERQIKDNNESENSDTLGDKCVNMNDTQQSVEFIGKINSEIISLETSLESIDGQNPLSGQPNSEANLESESSDNEFEEVSDNENKLQAASIQLTLNMGAEVHDDIFADIFHTDENKANILKKSNSGVCLSSEKNNQLSEPFSNRDMKNNLVKLDEPERNLKPTEKSGKNITNIENDISVNNQLNEANNSNVSKNEENEILSNSISNKIVTEISKKSNSDITIEKLNSLASEIENEEEELLLEKGRLDRIGRNITEQMTKEAQELLRVFGIPYIVAPMEAEAQCAFLENAKLTDGTITDDSDIWLFGGKTVYKNFFNQKKHVLQFLSERIEKSFNLNREQLVLLALLVGSDYTTGVSGVGPVTALEILASFPFNKRKLSSENSKQSQYQELITGLLEFKKWVKEGKRTDNISLKKKLKYVNLNEDFPSVRVLQAYLEPNIERSEEKFSWGEIDVTIIRDYTKAKFGWSQNKLDEIIKPVLKRMLDRKNQKTVYDYFKRKIEFQSLEDQMSKRVKAAVQKMGPESSISKTNEDSEVTIDKQKTKRKRKTKAKDSSEAGPSKTRRKDETKDIDLVVKSTAVNEFERVFDVTVNKSERYQEIIPQREMDKKNLLENKLKAIELFRKTKIDCKIKKTKRKLPVPKEKADLSESDSD